MSFRNQANDATRAVMTTAAVTLFLLTLIAVGAIVVRFFGSA